MSTEIVRPSVSKRGTRSGLDWVYLTKPLEMAEIKGKFIIKSNGRVCDKQGNELPYFVIYHSRNEEILRLFAKVFLSKARFKAKPTKKMNPDHPYIFRLEQEIFLLVPIELKEKYTKIVFTVFKMMSNFMYQKVLSKKLYTIYVELAEVWYNHYLIYDTVPDEEKHMYKAVMKFYRSPLPEGVIVKQPVLR